MAKNQNTHPNELLLYRRRMRLARKHVAQLIGHEDTSMLSRYETGRSLPPLLTALRLEILYRTPVAYLYYRSYVALRQQIRTQEESSVHRQPTLF